MGDASQKIIVKLDLKKSRSNLITSRNNVGSYGKKKRKHIETCK